MFRSRKIEDEIKMYLCFIESYVTSETKEYRTDAAKACEDIIKKALNIIGGNAININDIKPNAPGIDLLDKSEDAAYQITATFTNQKVHDTLEKFEKIIKNPLVAFDGIVPKLKILMLKYNIDDIKKKLKISEKFVSSFSVASDVLDLRTLLWRAKENNRETELLMYLKKECSPIIYSIIKSKDWRQIPSIGIISTTVHITAFDDGDFNSLMLLHYSDAVCLASNSGNDDIFKIDIEIKNISEIPITNIVFKEFYMGLIEEADFQSYTHTPISNECNITKGICCAIYPGCSKIISIFFNGDELNNDNIEMLAVSFRIMVSTIYNDIGSNQNFHLICSCQEVISKSVKYTVDDVASSIMVF